MTGKLTARPAGRPGFCLALASLRRFLLRLTPFANPGQPENIRRRFLRHAESIRPMWSVNPSLGWSNGLPPIDSNPSPRTPREENVLPIVRMSSDRLFLDRVGRHQSPSPLHRQAQTTMHFSEAFKKGTFLLCWKGGHSYFAATDVLLTLDRNLPYQQNLNTKRIAVLIVRARSNRVQDLLPVLPKCLAALVPVQPKQVARRTR